MGTLSSILGKPKEIEMTETERAVKNYFDANENKKKYEKDVKKFKKDIEKHFKPGDEQTLDRIGLSINWSKTESSVLNQEKLLTKIKELKLNDCIKTVELVDENMVSQKILDGELDPQVLVECTDKKSSTRLLINRVKQEL